MEISIQTLEQYHFILLQLQQKPTKTPRLDLIDDVEHLFHWKMEVQLNVIQKVEITAAHHGASVEAPLNIMIVQIVLTIGKMVHQVYQLCHHPIFQNVNWNNLFIINTSIKYTHLHFR